MTMTLIRTIIVLILTATASSQVTAGTAAKHWEKTCRSKAFSCVEVAGTGVHYFTTAIVHSVEPTPTGMVQRSTDIIDLNGDVEGRVLYHPVSVFDFTAGTLVNTGDQVFSGTVLGGEPVLIYDDSFRFDVNLTTGETTGKVLLNQPMAGGQVKCHLDIVGTGSTPEGDAMVDYTGVCRFRN